MLRPPCTCMRVLAIPTGRDCHGGCIIAIRLCWKSHWDAFCPQFHAIGIRPGWPVHEDSVVLAISAEKDGELRVVYARIGRCQGHPAWRVLKLRWRVLPPDDAAKFM